MTSMGATDINHIAVATAHQFLETVFPEAVASQLDHTLCQKKRKHSHKAEVLARPKKTIDNMRIVL